MVHVLTKALDEANELICWVAVDCLAQMGQAAREAVPALRRLLQKDFRISLIKKAVTLALERIDPQTVSGIDRRGADEPGQGTLSQDRPERQ